MGEDINKMMSNKSTIYGSVIIIKSQSYLIPITHYFILTKEFFARIAECYISTRLNGHFKKEDQLNIRFC